MLGRSLRARSWRKSIFPSRIPGTWLPAMIKLRVCPRLPPQLARLKVTPLSGFRSRLIVLPCGALGSAQPLLGDSPPVWNYLSVASLRMESLFGVSLLYFVFYFLGRLPPDGQRGEVSPPPVWLWLLVVPPFVWNVWRSPGKRSSSSPGQESL